MSNDKYIHSEVENKIYSYWEKNQLFKPKENSKKFSIVIPPKRVLHPAEAEKESLSKNKVPPPSISQSPSMELEVWS